MLHVTPCVVDTGDQIPDTQMRSRYDLRD